MSIFVNQATRLLVQGITGHQGRLHTTQMRADGTQIVAGVTPGKAGELVDGVPVFNSVAEALSQLKKRDGRLPTWSVSFVPAPFAKAAAFEALQAGLNTVIITEHLPVHDTLAIHQRAAELKLRAIGPNCPGIITPGDCKIGIMPASVFQPGPVGVISRSGTLTYEVVSHLSAEGIGQSTCIGIGGDPINLTNLEEALLAFEADSATKVIVLIGEIGGNQEEYVAAHVIGRTVTKPIVAYLAGRSAPPGKTLGHAGAIIEAGSGSIESKEQALTAAGVSVARLPAQVASLVQKALQ